MATEQVLAILVIYREQQRRQQRTPTRTRAPFLALPSSTLVLVRHSVVSYPSLLLLLLLVHHRHRTAREQNVSDWAFVHPHSHPE